MSLPRRFTVLCSIVFCLSLDAALPRIDEISTNAARLGREITIYGDNFVPNALVLVGGMPAPVLAGGVGYLQVRVPGGALPGPVVVAEDGNVAVSSDYLNPLPATPGALTNSFAERELSRQTGLLPIGAAADFDRDGKSDVVVAGVNSLHIFHNASGEGLLNSNSFSSISLPMTGAASSLAAGDLNGDGKPDIVYTQGDAVVARQNQISDGTIGAESFLFPVVLQSRSLFRPVHIADVDNDGRPDILAASASAGLTVLWNRSSGDTIKKTDFTNTFVISSVEGFSSKGVLDFQVADLNRDGHADIVAVVGTNLVVFALQDQSGKLRTNFIESFILGPAQATYLEYGPTGLAVADLDGDGMPDVVVSEPRNVVAYLNRSRPDRFGTSSFEKVILVSGGYRSFLVGDFDGDGAMELLIENKMIFRTRGANGGFVTSSGRDRILVEADLATFALANLNGDNRTDVLGLKGSPASLRVLQNLGAPAAPKLVLRQNGLRRTLHFSGLPMTSYHLQTSTDLLHWQTSVDLRVGTAAEMDYLDPSSNGKTFFRLVQE